MSGASNKRLGLQGLPVVGKTCLTTMDKKLNILNEKVDRLLNFQEDVTEKLQCVCQEMGHLEQGLHRLEASRGLGLSGVASAPPSDAQADWPEVLELVRGMQQDRTQHGTGLEALCRMVVAVDRAITLVGATFQNSKEEDFAMQGDVPWRKGSLADGPEENKEQVEEKGAKPKHLLSTRGVQADLKGPWEGNKKAELPEGTVERVTLISTPGMGVDFITRAGALLGQEDAVLSLDQVVPDCQLLPTKVQAKDHEIPSENPESGLKLSIAPDQVCISQETALSTRQKALSGEPDPWTPEENMTMTSGPSSQPSESSSLASVASSDGEALPWISMHVQEMDTSSKLLITRRGSLRPTPPSGAPAAVTSGEKDLPGPRCYPEAPGDESEEQASKGTGEFPPLHKTDGNGGANVEEKQRVGSEPAMGPSLAQRKKEDAADETPDLQQDKGPGTGSRETEDCGARDSGRAEAGGKMYPGAEAGGMVLDDSPAPPAPFEHRVVCVKETSVSAGYTVCHHEVLGGGRFGQVHRCTERSTGLPLAAKIIKVKSAKDREVVKNEISIMNQLSHMNLIQLYDAFESKNNFTLIMEYVDGGELFDRITDEKYHLTELDVVLFTKQICEGVHFLHQHYILHLDLKPENILCVNQTGHQIKIIDFGLARRYKPREKLKVNFGTPEFLAPEVVNYEFVSFPTDMWSVGVITYILLSGLSPFLGDTDTETMNFIVNCSWDFDVDTFEGLSEEAKDFVSRLLVKEKSCRMSATQCLKHEWLNNLPAKASKFNVCLKSQLLLQKYMAQRKWKKHFYVVTAASRLKKFPACS
ncbi:myosin light chain kinase 3 [Perognathus longimembris pacificus]|uniref:myosin light chain kinase 3 n=1 Tax=Perognathus longimembris pacificus TaxID=214514 RepID=UPI002019CBCF|nr:myosin light chain kinase 3 [Perognathus longimembris pacificus]